MNKTVLVCSIGIVLSACAASGDQLALEESSYPVKRDCIEDKDSLMALDYEAFDQDMWGGWREVSYRNNNGCQLEAAQLISEYKLLKPELADWQLRMLHWHEGQLYAFTGESEKAIELFSKSYQPNPKTTAWNLYVTASIAFLNKDRETFDQSYDELRNIPEPANWDDTVKNTQEKFNYTPRWPTNINVFEAFDRCFDKPYSEAYSNCNAGIRKNVRKTGDSAKASESP